MSTQLHFGRDDQGYNAVAPQFPTDIFGATLAANTARSVTVPSNHSTWIMYAQVQPNGWCWCSRTQIAQTPSGGTFSASASEMIVGTREFRRIVFGGDTISFITLNTTCDIEVAFQYIPSP